MELKDFDYYLPEELIAQRPLKERDSSRLLVLDRKTGEFRHGRFSGIKEHLRHGDLLVLNDTKVLRARLMGRKETGGRVEVLLVRRALQGGATEVWSCIIGNSKGLKAGSRISFEGPFEAEILKAAPDGLWECAFHGDFSALPFEDALEKAGKVPLPPYIRREAEEEDAERYQTVYARNTGAIAAPTAGLHFTPALLEDMRGMGIEVCYITLHTGPGTFLPVRAQDLREHRMMAERYHIDASAFDAVVSARRQGRRVIAVGSTCTRALESAVIDGFDRPRLEGDTSLFICPGFTFRAVDALVTNFHLPGSTLLMLVSAFAGRENIMRAYAAAVEEKYRFFSYGDAMLIL